MLAFAAFLSSQLFGKYAELTTLREGEIARYEQFGSWLGTDVSAFVRENGSVHILLLHTESGQKTTKDFNLTGKELATLNEGIRKTNFDRLRPKKVFFRWANEDDGIDAVWTFRKGKEIEWWTSALWRKLKGVDVQLRVPKVCLQLEAAIAPHIEERFASIEDLLPEPYAAYAALAQDDIARYESVNGGFLHQSLSAIVDKNGLVRTHETWWDNGNKESKRKFRLTHDELKTLREGIRKTNLSRLRPKAFEFHWMSGDDGTDLIFAFRKGTKVEWWTTALWEITKDDTRPQLLPDLCTNFGKVIERHLARFRPMTDSLMLNVTRRLNLTDAIEGSHGGVHWILRY